MYKPSFRFHLDPDFQCGIRPVPTVIRDPRPVLSWCRAAFSTGIGPAMFIVSAFLVGWVAHDQTTREVLSRLSSSFGF